MAGGTSSKPPPANSSKRRKDPADGNETAPLIPTNSVASKLVREIRTKGFEFHARSVALLVSIPWSVFVLVAASTALLLERLAIVSCLVVLACLTVAIIFIIVHFREQKKIHFRERQGPFYIYLGVFSLFAIFFGCCAGKMVSDDYMAQYWSPSIRPSYFDVSPMSLATSVGDAGVIQFTEGTRVDTMRSVGMLDIEDGSTYCVAPVLSADEPSQVEFWATGMDCCRHRGAFHCDDAQQVSATSGVTVPVFGSRRAKWRAVKLAQAAKMASVVYGLHTAQQPVFLHWVKVPSEFRQSELLKAFVMLLCQCAIYLAVSFVFAACAHWSTAQSLTSGSSLYKLPSVAKGIFDSKGGQSTSQV